MTLTTLILLIASFLLLCIKWLVSYFLLKNMEAREKRVIEIWNEIQDPCFAQGIAASRAGGLDRLIAKDIKDKK